MSCGNSNINEIFIIEPAFASGCTVLNTDAIISCSGNAEILLLTGQTIFNTSIIPLVDNTIDLGSTTNRFTNIIGTTISATTYLNLPPSSNLSAGTNINFTSLSGITYINVIPIFNNVNVTGLTSSETISATTYQNLPIDIRVTGGTVSAGTATFTNNTGGTFSISGFDTSLDTFITGFTYNDNQFVIFDSTGGTFSVIANTMTGLTVNGIFSATTYQGLPTDIYVTGGTYSNGVTLFTNNTGGTFSVSGFFTGVTDTDIFLTGVTLNNNTLIFTDSTGGTSNIIIDNLTGLTVNRSEEHTSELQ